MKHEFSKIILGLVMLLYFLGAVFGGYIVAVDHTGIEALLTYIGAPTATAIGFYAWKARAENVIKISKDVERDKKIPENIKNEILQNVINAVSKTDWSE